MRSASARSGPGSVPSRARPGALGGQPAPWDRTEISSLVRTSGVSRGWNGNHTPVSDRDLEREEPAVLPANKVMSLLGAQDPPPAEESITSEDEDEHVERADSPPQQTSDS